jgi:Protein of unknown function (DUF2971)
VPRAATFVLWHYTSVQGLVGILTSRSLRLSDARFLNDRTERTYSLDVIETIINRRSTFRSSADRAVAKRVVARMRANLRASPLFVSSLSEARETLSQWRRYGANGMGYCIGFEPWALSDAIAVLESGSLQKIWYGPNQQRDAIRSVLHSSVVTGFDEQEIQASLERIALQMKSPVFADEKEWRLVCAPGQNPPGMSHDIKDPYLSPFITLRFGNNDDNQRGPSVAAVICGPRLDHVMASTSIRTFLDAQGYTTTSVLRSVIADTWR